jgi:hypothetical protein
MEVKTAIKSGLIGVNHSEAQPRAPAAGSGLTVQTSVKAGFYCGPGVGTTPNHNETLAAGAHGLKVQTAIKAGVLTSNHSEAQARATSRGSGFAVQTAIKAGLMGANHSEAQARAPVAGLAVQTAIRAGFRKIIVNHNEALARLAGR